MSIDPEADLIARAQGKPQKPLKHARSLAEITRVRQGYAMISIQSLNVVLSVLIALKTFHII